MGLTNETVVIFSSDNGYNMGHNGIWHKGNGIWATRTTPPDTENINLIRAAKQLLLAGFTIADVAAQTGFVDQSHLTNRFKRVVGVTPGQYRQDSKNLQDTLPCRG